MSIIRCRLSCFIFLLSAVFWVGGLCQADAAVDSLTKLRSLSPEEAALGKPVSVEGQVLWVHPLSAGLFLHDGKKGAYAQNPKGKLPFSDFRPGQWIRVSGVTDAGGFSPSIGAEDIVLIEERPMIEARHFFPYQIYSTNIDCDWVTLRGRFISSKIIPEYSIIMLELDMNGVRLLVQLVDRPETRERLSEVMYRQVRFNAVAGSRFNKERQFTGLLFFIDSFDRIKVDNEPEDLDNVRAVPIHELLRAGDNYRTATKTYGSVTYAVGNEVYLRGEKACIMASVLDSGNLAVGDRVELAGLVEPEPFGPAFLARDVRVLESNYESIEAVPVALGWEIDPKLNFDLIELDAQLVDVGKSFATAGHRGSGELSLLCRSGAYLIEARLPESVEVDSDWKVGATLRLRGICHLKMNPADRWRIRNVKELQLQLRSAEDVMVLNPPPWWTTTRVLWIAGVGAGSSVLFFIWVLVLRKTVSKQTRIIGNQIERETLLNERQRIARELHDNLEQGLAGTVLQLKGLRKLVDNHLKCHVKSMIEGNRDLRKEAEVHAEKNKRAIDLILKMLTRCSDEARTSILDLRGGLLERMGLADALRESLQPLVEECGASLKLHVTGKARRLPYATERSLLQLVKEATANAVRHGRPDAVDVVLDYQPKELMISVTDNGVGFNTALPPKAGHFGLLGMHERMNKLKGSLQVKSCIGEGTEIVLTLPAEEADNE
ncbi:sensor histidine kinase [Pontiella agarivorans]|uniref:Sensor histidine kinase n=1 Tax=Pontiella agarivorans TaxID=3038953 RepID=A0ABU5MX58_9BACT|nr:sensor histidine kinase [Pontiella agarivorans]MDZ8118769.1 sensor histidine kinase [Pontiella agarivorans]